MVKTSLSHLAKRLPMIKFRYGLGREQVKHTTISGSPAPPGTIPASGNIPRVSSGPAIEDWQLPPRYQRKPIDKYEMDWINRGGPE